MVYLNFLYTVDNVYYDLMRLSIISAIKYHKGATFHIFTMDSPETNQIRVPRKNEEKLKREIALIDPTAKILFYNVRDLYLEKLGNSVNEYSRYTPYAALRLLAPYILNDVNLVLYLDADTIITDSLHKLFVQYSNKDFDVAMALENYNQQNNDIPFLSGLILFNLKYQRKTNYRFIDEVIRLYNSNIYPYPDQDALRFANPAKRIILEGYYLHFEYDPNIEPRTKVVCVPFRNLSPVTEFMKNSVFHRNAINLYHISEYIAKQVSDINIKIYNEINNEK